MDFGIGKLISGIWETITSPFQNFGSDLQSKVGGFIDQNITNAQWFQTLQSKATEIAYMIAGLFTGMLGRFNEWLGSFAEGISPSPAETITGLGDYISANFKNSPIADAVSKAIGGTETPSKPGIGEFISALGRRVGLSSDPAKAKAALAHAAALDTAYLQIVETAIKDAGTGIELSDADKKELATKLSTDSAAKKYAEGHANAWSAAVLSAMQKGEDTLQLDTKNIPGIGTLASAKQTINSRLQYMAALPEATRSKLKPEQQEALVAAIKSGKIDADELRTISGFSEGSLLEFANNMGTSTVTKAIAGKDAQIRDYRIVSTEGKKSLVADIAEGTSSIVANLVSSISYKPGFNEVSAPPPVASAAPAAGAGQTPAS